MDTINYKLHAADHKAELPFFKSPQLIHSSISLTLGTTCPNACNDHSIEKWQVCGH